MTSTTGISRQQAGLVMSVTNLFAGLTGFVYQFMPDGTFLTFLVCMVAILGLVSNSKTFDERERELLLQSYGTAFIYLFFAVVIVYLFVMFSSELNLAGPVIDLINNHWVGIMASIMCILIGVAGIRNFRDIK